ncbi:MAG: glycosyltransferase [Sedimentisphaerales bacterium]|nr:glycosyltransferase [Sedimentisphaerales bacterium]
MRIRLRHGFDLIWATGDPWNSLMAGWWLSKLTGKPLVADFRDPWTYGVLWSPRDEQEALWNERWERRIVAHASRTVFTSPLTSDIMAQKYGPLIGGHFVTITNGFDDATPVTATYESNDKCVFRFVGSLGGNREPSALFKAIVQARTDPGFLRDARFEFVGRMNKYEAEVERFGLSDMVQYVGMVGYDASRSYMQTADVLILLQTMSGGEDCISGKAFEYLAARRPVLAIVPENGGDAWLIRSTCSGTVTGLSSSKVVAEELLRYWRQWRDKGRVDPPRSQGVQQYSRRNTSRQLAKLFDEVLNARRRRRSAPAVAANA